MDDTGSVELQLDVPVKYFAREYKSIFVSTVESDLYHIQTSDELFFKINENGLLSFLTEIPTFYNVQFPLEYPLIAGLYSDVDTTESGQIWYRKVRSNHKIRE